MPKLDNFVINKKTPFSGQVVDIIVPFHGQYDRVTKLIEDIFRFTYSNRYTLCLVDDCSPNAEYIESLKKVPGVQCLRNNEQIGFGGACEAGFLNTKNPWVVFLHSDCRISDIGWLKVMGECLLELKSKMVRMVAPRTDNAVNGDPSQESQSTENNILDDGFLSLYCFMCHRGLFSRIGGFLKPYPYGGYEDEEVAFRMKKCGYRQAVCGKGWVGHVGQATVKDVCRRNTEVVKVITEGNRDRAVMDMKNFKE